MVLGVYLALLLLISSHPWLAVLLYPCALAFLPEPVAGKWGLDHGFQPMPAETRDRAERNGRYLLFLQFIIIIGEVVYLARKYSIPWSDIGMRFESWPRLLMVGAAVGLMLVATRALTGLLFPHLDSREESEHPFVRGPAALWVLLLLMGGAAEELWRAISLVTIMEAGWTPTAAVAGTSIAFVLGRSAGIPKRIREILEELFFTMVVGAILAGLFLVFRALLVPYLTHLILNLTLLYRLRRRVPIAA